MNVETVPCRVQFPCRNVGRRELVTDVRELGKPRLYVGSRAKWGNWSASMSGNMGLIEATLPSAMENKRQSNYCALPGCPLARLNGCPEQEFYHMGELRE